MFISKLLKCVEKTHPSHIGNLIKLVLPKLLTVPQLATARLVANLASRKVELLLTMPMEDVHKEIAKEELLEIINKLVSLNLVKK